MKKPSQSQQLVYYGLHKQISVGKCNEKQPGRLNIIARAKWDAWNKLGNMSKEEAQKKYVEEITKADPNWQKIKSKL